MTDNVENIVLEHLKAIRAEQASARDRDSELLRRLAHLETMIARIGRDQAQAVTEQVDDRHTIDRLQERIERIERRLEISGG